MLKYQLGDADARFAEIIWSNEPISSGDLVKLCEQEMSWKKSTVYTVLRKLCQRGIFENNDSIVTSKISREKFMQLQSIEFVADTFGGSLPGFLTAFMGGKKLDKEQAEKIKQLIEQYQED
ncbi:MAG: BlaI/MecI/CopY family transcriptional regulator [Lachnospiraceae bacterium]|nr:BlaI/MecI/CopY family transcriptional regulator [Lachnospiraceae bacterium]